MAAITIQYGAGAPIIRGAAVSSIYSLSAEDKSITNATVQIQDQVFTGLTVPNFHVTVNGASGVQLSSATPGVCSIDGQGNVSCLDDGMCIIQTQAMFGSTSLWWPMSFRNTGTFSGFSTGSLSKHICDAFTTMLQGKVAGAAAQAQFTSYSGTTGAPAVVRNPSAFCSGLDLTGMSVMTGSNSAMFPWMLISPRHIIGANHVSPGTGPFVWQDAQGNYHTANRVRGAQVDGGSVYGSSDIHVAYLDTPVTGVTPFSLLPSTWAQYIPHLTLDNRDLLSVGTTNQAGLSTMPFLVRVHTAQSGVNPWGDGFALSHVGQGIDPVASNMAFETSAVGGDSGSPIFLPINGEAVLVSAWWTQIQGPWYANYISSINAAMNSVKDVGDNTTYSVRLANLSSFQTF